MLGDILEWLGGAAFVAAAFHWSGLTLALGVAGLVLFYEAQCYSGHKIRLPFRRRNPNEGH